MIFSRKLPYSQEQVAEQIGQIADLIKMRKSSQLVDEVNRFSNSIEMAQHVLEFMLDEVRAFQEKK